MSNPMIAARITNIQTGVDTQSRIVHFQYSTKGVFLLLNETIATELALDATTYRLLELPDSTTINVPQANSIRLELANKSTLCNVLIQPGNADCILPDTILRSMGLAVNIEALSSGEQLFSIVQKPVSFPGITLYRKPRNTSIAR